MSLPNNAEETGANRAEKRAWGVRVEQERAPSPRKVELMWAEHSRYSHLITRVTAESWPSS